MIRAANHEAQESDPSRSTAAVVAPHRGSAASQLLRVLGRALLHHEARARVNRAVAEEAAVPEVVHAREACGMHTHAK